MILREAFREYGTVLSCRVFQRNGRTCALVKMSMFEEAEVACRAMSRTGGPETKSRWFVKFADADVGAGGTMDISLASLGLKGGDRLGRREREPDHCAAPSDNLYVKGLLPRITESQLHRTFSRAGQVVEMKVLRYEDSLECSALIRMASIEAAAAAIEMLHGTVPEGSVPSLTIRYHGKDPSKPSDNLYVKGLPLNFMQESLESLFSECGTVRRCRILMAPPRHVALDSAALVQMSTVEEATQVLQTLHGRVPDGIGPYMTIRYAEVKAGTQKPEQAPTDNLYVKGLPLGTPDFLLKAVFEQYAPVVRLKILEARGALDCAALVQLATVDGAKAAVEALHSRVLASPMPAMRVRFAGRPDQPPGSNLYVGGLPVTMDESQLRATFSQCGTVVRLRLLVQAGRPETHALVQMASVEEAQLAVSRLHGSVPDTLGPTLVVRYATNRARGGSVGTMVVASNGPRMAKGFSAETSQGSNFSHGCMGGGCCGHVPGGFGGCALPELEVDHSFPPGSYNTGYVDEYDDEEVAAAMAASEAAEADGYGGCYAHHQPTMPDSRGPLDLSAVPLPPGSGPVGCGSCGNYVNAGGCTSCGNCAPGPCGGRGCGACGGCGCGGCGGCNGICSGGCSAFTGSVAEGCGYDARPPENDFIGCGGFGCGGCGVPRMCGYMDGGGGSGVRTPEEGEVGG